jgi:site-specific recombinase XerC
MGGDITAKSDEPIIAVPQTSGGNPAVFYLASLRSNRSRITMHDSLNIVAGILTGTTDAFACDWASVRYQQVLELRTRLAERYSPATVNKMLSGLRSTTKAAWRLGQITTEDYQKAVSVKRFRPEKSPPQAEISRENVDALMQACKQDQGLYGIRDTAIIGLLFNYNLKPSAVAALNLDDYDVRVGRLAVHDKKGKAKTLCFDDGIDRNLFNWLKIRGWEPGPIFWPMTIGSKLKSRRMTFQVIRTVPGNWIRRPRLPTTRLQIK